MAITLEWQVGDESIVADRHGTWRLRGGEVLADIGEAATNASEQIAEISGECLCGNGESKSDEDDKHRIFGDSGTALVTDVAFDQIKHLKFLLAVRVRHDCQC
jgi:hypothetical protein